MIAQGVESMRALVRVAWVESYHLEVTIVAESALMVGSKVSVNVNGQPVAISHLILLFWKRSYFQWGFSIADCY